ncbi:MAG: hypothetical protein FWF01_00740 [Alphaproteobacteria bacterium]|nr:hypothetical protein [Alphaproteobacteria bacterium]
MKLTEGKTQWVFLLASSNKVEERHVYDIGFGVHCLEKKKVNPDNITLIIQDDDGTASLLMQRFSDHPYRIHTVFDLGSIIANPSYDNLMLFITGHGSIEGIDFTPHIKPYQLLSYIQDARNLHTAVVYFGQCYAGIFHYMPASRKDRGDGTSTAEIIGIGAANLYNSISSPMTVFPKSQNELSWSANMFLFHTFLGILHSVDVDGDGKFTVMDAYKFAAGQTNSHQTKMKSGQLLKIRTLYTELELIEQKLSAEDIKSPDHFKYKQDYEAIITQIYWLSGLQFNHQESWVLNSNPAQIIEI